MRIRTLLLVCLLAVCGAIPALASADETVMVCDVYGNHVAPRPAGVRGIATSVRCPGNTPPNGYAHGRPPGGLAIWTLPHKVVKRGRGVKWTVTAPAGLRLLSISIPHMYSHGIDDGDGWSGGFYWGGGSRGVSTSDGENSWSSHARRSHFRWPSNGTTYFGWSVRCSFRRCTNGGKQWLSVELLELHVRETARPRLVAPDGLWQAKGWIRGEWRFHIYGDSPSGMCSIWAKLNGKPGAAELAKRHVNRWHQCNATPIDDTVDTSQYGQGVLPLTISGEDAAGLTVTKTRTVDVDNQRPTISLSGPTEASTSAGTQYIHAQATAGPSGVAAIACSLDSAPPRWYASSAAAIPVSGIGVHHLVCYSQSNARNAAGQRATSAPATWTLSIRAPSVSTITFDRIGSALRCVRRRERKQIPGHWRVEHHHGQRDRVWVPPRTEWSTVVHCHLRVVHRSVQRNGRWIRTRVLLLPRRVSRNRLRIPFGKRATVSGWLGTPDGDALAGQRVRIMTAPADGRLHFTQAAVARTSDDGIWKARLPRGPSRVVLAVYRGATIVQPSRSEAAHLVVPASVALHIHPRRTHWTGTIRIRGRVRGGYIPRSGEVVFLYVGWRGGSAEIGHLNTKPDGRFSTTYTFLRGRGTERYRLWAVTGRESDYPYAPGRSHRVPVTVRQ